MKKFMSCLVGGLVALFLSASACAAPSASQTDQDLLDYKTWDCDGNTLSQAPQGAQRVVYVNGVLVDDWFIAKDASDKMRNILCSNRTDTTNGIQGSHHHSTAAKTFVFQVVYNPIGWDSALGGDKTAATAVQDVKELFQLKAGEEYYLPSDGNGGLSCPSYLCSAHDGPRSNSALSGTDLSGLLEITTRADYMETSSRGTSNSWSASNGLESNDSTFANQMNPTKAVVYKLAGIMKYQGSTIVVAHSQGNLIANLAYAYAKYDLATMPVVYNTDGTISGDGIKDIVRKVRIVNVANTSAVSINGLSLKHDGDGVVKTLLGEGAPLVWWRATPRANNGLYTDHRAFYIEPSTMGVPVDTGSAGQLAAKGAAKADFDASVGDIGALPDDVRAIIQNTKDYVSGYFSEHFMVDTYLSDRMTSVNDGQTRGVNYFAPCQSFRDFFEDLVYTASSSLDAANSTVPLGNYVTTNFSTPVPNMAEFTYGSGSHGYDSTSKTYTVSGTDMFRITLPANVKTLDFTAHLKLIANDAQSNQFGITVNGAGGPDRLYFDILHNLAICGTDGNKVLAMTADPGPWQCNVNSVINTSLYINAGWVKLHVNVDSVQCTMHLDITRDSDGYYDGFGANLTPLQCQYARSAVRFSPGSPSNTASMVFDGLSISTTQ